MDKEMIDLSTEIKNTIIEETPQIGAAEE